MISSPSSYLKNALYYSEKQKSKFVALLTDEDYLNPETLEFKPIKVNELSMEEEILNRVESEKTLENIYNLIDNFIIEEELNKEDSEELIEHITNCLELGKDYNKFLYKIPIKKMKECFTTCFELIKEELIRRTSHE